MKNILLHFVLIIVFIINPGTSFARQTDSIPSTPVSLEQKAWKQTRWLANYLKLTDETTQMIYTIQLKYLSRIDSVRSINTEMLDKRDVYLQIEVNKNRELQLILSPEQYVNYLQMFEKEKKKTQ